MTKSLDSAIEKIRKLPADRQEEAAAVLLEIAERGDRGSWLTPAQAEEVRRSMQDRDFLSEDEVDALYRKYGA